MMKQFVILMTLTLLSGASCQTQNPSPSGNRASSPATADSSKLADTNTTAPSERFKNSLPKTIYFDAPDGVRIVGTFYGPAMANSPAVLMLHQFGGNRAAYRDLAEQFQAGGIAVLTIDGRGFGESTVKADGSKVTASQSNDAVAGMKLDVTAAVKFLSEQKNVDLGRIGIIGASYGSSLAIIHAAGNPEIRAVALLSPGTNYFGNLPTEPAVEKYGARPILIVAAEDDDESVEASRRLDKLASGEKHQLEIYKRGGHGTGILGAGVGLEKLMLEFFRQNL